VVDPYSKILHTQHRHFIVKLDLRHKTTMTRIKAFWRSRGGKSHQFKGVDSEYAIEINVSLLVHAVQVPIPLADSHKSLHIRLWRLGRSWWLLRSPMSPMRVLKSLSRGYHMRLTHKRCDYQRQSNSRILGPLTLGCVRHCLKLKKIILLTAE
jgi:hypothetical protein